MIRMGRQHRFVHLTQPHHKIPEAFQCEANSKGSIGLESTSVTVRPTAKLVFLALHVDLYGNRY
jgi:hypothetical protein